MTKIMILNGPPRCGKTTAAVAIEQYFSESVCKHIKLSEPLKLIASNVFGKSANELEENTDDVLSGMTMSFRDAQIHTFNQLIPVYGEDWLGKWTVNSLHQYDQDFFVISDGGRSSEIMPFIRAIGPENLLVVQIMREGCSFINDIRSYITAPNVRTRPTVNRDIEDFKAEMIDFAGEFFSDE